MDLALIDRCFVRQGISSDLYYKIFKYLILGKYLKKFVNYENLHLFYHKVQCFECNQEIIIQESRKRFRCNCAFECECQFFSKIEQALCQTCDICEKVLCLNNSGHCDACGELLCQSCQPEQCDEHEKICCAKCCKIYNTRTSRFIRKNYACYDCIAGMFVDSKHFLEQYREIDVSSLGNPEFGTIGIL
jgi:hypothetical protein